MGRPPNSANLSPWEALRSYPPIIVRLLARRRVAGKNVRALASPEVAIAAGIPLKRVMEIQQLESWDTVTFSEGEAFCRACAFDPLNANDRKRQSSYARVCLTKYPNRPPQYLLRSPSWLTEFEPLTQRLRSLTSFSTASPRSA